jgi:hypothetical protein
MPENNMVLRERDETTGEWRILYKRELCHLYSSPTIVKMVKSGGLQWLGCLYWMEETIYSDRILVGKYLRE